MSANKLSHLLESSQVDWSRLVMLPDTGCWLRYSFPLSPDDFLKFARDDLQAGGVRGYINALSNAKRAMDCRVESIVCAVGYTPSGLRAQLGKENVQMIEEKASDSTLPFIYKFFESLGGFTPSLLDRVRRLRHDVEHRFQKPTKKKAGEALEIAELFVRSTEGLVSDVYDSFGFGSGQSPDPRFRDMQAHVINIQLDYNAASSKGRVTLWDRTDPARESFSDSPSVEVLPKHASYYWLLRLSFALSRNQNIQPTLRRFVTSSGASILTRSVKVVGLER